MRATRRSIPIIALLILGLAASGASLANGFAYDDVRAISGNPVIHTLAAPWVYAQQPYWYLLGILYRPLTIWLFAVQWQIGGGAPWVFHLTNVLLILASTLAVYALAKRLMHRAGAWLVAALFAVHPVHVEVVGNAVGQSELLCTLATTLTVLAYLRVRATDQVIPWHQGIGIALLAALAAFAKEEAFMIPLLLGAAELILVRSERSWRDRIGLLRPAWGGLGLALLLVLLCRSMVLQGAGAGPLHVAFRDLGVGGRLLTMLTIVPQWARLLLWPAHLQADYGPPGITGVTTLTAAGVLGLLLLALFVVALAATWRRMPAVAFGLAWCAIALFPVSNFVIPTGVLLAERTLFMPSVGAMIAVGAVLWWLMGSARESRWVQSAAIAMIGVILLLGVLRSARRQQVWRDSATLFAYMSAHEPSARGPRLYAEYLSEQGDPQAAEVFLRQSAAMAPGNAEVYEALGQVLRSLGRCDEAVPVLETALKIEPERAKARGRLFTCLQELGDTARARQVATDGMAQGITVYRKLLTEDGAAKASR